MLSSCAPVLSRDVMKQALQDVPLSAVRQAPAAYAGKIFILGGMIVETRVTAKGSLIEALSLPIDSYGYLKYQGSSEGRYLALLPTEKGMLDPAIFAKGREITVAGEFRELRKGKIDEVEYVYPLFEIRELYLWQERRDYYAYPGYPWYGYPYWYYDPWYYDPWWRPYPPPYWPSPRR
jgi:outer membrane lipoprotein